MLASCALAAAEESPIIEQNETDMAMNRTDVPSVSRSRVVDLPLVRRPWSQAERNVVIQGLLGRLVIAVEPAICFLVFAAITVALVFFRLPAGAKLTRFEAAIVIAPVFAVAALAFLAYAVAVLYAPIRALRQTFSPIFIVDGYLRFRRPDSETEHGSNGYVAVLDDARQALAEWPTLGQSDREDDERPAMIEFTFYGGVHRIDGRETGVLPQRLRPLGVGLNTRR